MIDPGETGFAFHWASTDDEEAFFAAGIENPAAKDLAAYCEAFQRALREGRRLPGMYLLLVNMRWQTGNNKVSPAKVQRLIPLVFTLPPIVNHTHSSGDQLGQHGL